MDDSSGFYNSLFNIGDYVHITQSGLKGWIVGKQGTTIEDMTLDIQYELDDTVERNVMSTNVTVTTLNHGNI